MALELAVLVAAAVAAGAINSVAGGGSFLTFPALLLSGVSPIAANATNTLALWPGSVASAGAYRRDLAHERRALLVLAAVSLAGGLVGAVLLLGTPEQTFAALVPWLLGGATLLFAVGPRLTRGRPARWGQLGTVAALQFLIAVYGGYFGGGMGILMLAGLSLLGMTDIHAMNGLKVLLGVVINGIALVAFAFAGVLVYPIGLAMAVGAVVGGYGGPLLAKRVPQVWVRRFVLAVGVVLTGYFFVRGA